MLVYLPFGHCILLVKLFHLVINQSFTSLELLVSEPGCLESVLCLLKLVFHLPIFLFFVDFVVVFEIELLFKPVYGLLTRLELLLGLLDLVFSTLNLVQVPLDDLSPVVIHF
jgi:hypothetical protein